MDGFTMEELAEVAGVSRRTLFNYYPSKVDALMGPELELPAETLDVFIAGGPTGHLADDMLTLVHGCMEEAPTDPDSLVRFERIVHANPQVLLAMKDRMHRLAEHVVEAAVRRPDGAVAAHDAMVAVRVLASIAEVAVMHFVENPERSLAEHYTDSYQLVRQLFG